MMKLNFIKNNFVVAQRFVQTTKNYSSRWTLINVVNQSAEKFFIPTNFLGKISWDYLKIFKVNNMTYSLEDYFIFSFAMLSNI